MAKRMDEFEELRLLEMELVDPTTRKNVARLNELIAEEFEEFGSSGESYSKQDILSKLPIAPEVSYVLSKFTFKGLAEECILVKYQSIVSGARAYRSSIWVKSSGHWQLLHHQTTTL